jgi:hypothetical protein
MNRSDNFSRPCMWILGDLSSTQRTIRFTKCGETSSWVMQGRTSPVNKHVNDDLLRGRRGRRTSAARMMTKNSNLSTEGPAPITRAGQERRRDRSFGV